MIRKVPKMKLVVNGDDALSAYLAMDSGNACTYYGISKAVMKSKTNEDSGRVVSANAAARDYSTVFIIIASLVITNARNAVSIDRFQNMMLLMYR